MAKTAKLKKDSTANPRSRASKRASSPSINLDKSIKQAPRASDATPILAVRPNGGVTKPQKKQKTMTRRQRRRQERGLARAQAVQDQMARKVEDAAGRLKNRRERKGMWDEVNGTNKFDKLMPVGDEENEAQKGEWEDMEEVEDDTAPVTNTEGPQDVAETKLVVVDRTASVVVGAITEEDDDLDKIT